MVQTDRQSQALAGPRIGNRYLAHVGGAGRLMELQGPQQFQDSFAKDILRFNRGGIVRHTPHFKSVVHRNIYVDFWVNLRSYSLTSTGRL
jgi:hypothetical protein